MLGGVIGGIGSSCWRLLARHRADRADLIGLRVSVVFIAMLKLIAVWFEENRFATLVGFSMLIGNSARYWPAHRCRRWRSDGWRACSSASVPCRWCLPRCAG
jgi:hypothetical protein